MAKKFKAGDKVIVVATEQEGVVKSRDIVKLEDGKRVEIQYIVKLGEGFNNWKSFNKNEIKPVERNLPEPYPRFYFREYKDDNSTRKITLAACVDKDFFSGNKVLSIGCAVLHPGEEMNVRMGRKIARHRAINRPMAHMESYLKGEFQTDSVYGFMDVKARYIFDHIENFITKE